MKIVGALTAVMVLSFSVASEAVAQSMVYGIGTVSCGTYLTYKTQFPEKYQSAVAWTTGYLSAMGQQLKIADLMATTDLNGVIG